MLNNVQDGNSIKLPLTGKESGKPVSLGNIVGVAKNDSEPDGTTVVLADQSIVDVEVVENQAGNISNGDKLYINGSDVVSNDAAGTYFGTAYSRDNAGVLIGTGNTATIEVKMKGGA